MASGCPVIGGRFKQRLVGHQIDGVEVIDVDGAQAALFGTAQQVGFGLVDDDVAAAGEPDLPVEGVVDLALDTQFLKDGRGRL